MSAGAHPFSPSAPLLPQLAPFSSMPNFGGADALEPLTIHQLLDRDDFEFALWFEEIQAAKKGRKGAAVDLRPIDPPPVVSLTFASRQDVQMPWTTLLPRCVQSLGLICAAELYPLLGVEDRWPKSNREQPCHFVNNVIPIFESTRLTSEVLVGDTCIQPTFVTWLGNEQLVFSFGNLVVRMEGMFILRYRLFELDFSSPEFLSGLSSSNASAECWGTPFQIYSSKTFPNLDPSTPLSLHLASLGVKVNKRKKQVNKVESRSRQDTSPLQTSMALVIIREAPRALFSTNMPL